jgi:hypothetical protein
MDVDAQNNYEYAREYADDDTAAVNSHGQSNEISDKSGSDNDMPDNQ